MSKQRDLSSQAVQTRLNGALAVVLSASNALKAEKFKFERELDRRIDNAEHSVFCDKQHCDKFNLKQGRLWAFRCWLAGFFEKK